MNKKIFRLNMMTSILVLIVSFILIFGILYSYFEGQIFNELKNEVNYIAYAVSSEGISYIKNFNNNDKRITLISSDGTVLADTDTDAEKLDNHSNRQEFIDAQNTGVGSSVRYSDTLMQKTLYYAIKLDNGNIIRISTVQNSIIVILLSFLQPIFMVLVIAFIISFILSNNISKSILTPINNINLDNPLNNDTYEELTPLLRKISNQNKTITNQIKIAERKQEEFKLITENMSEGFLIIDSSENILTYNRAAASLLDIDGVKTGSILTFNRTKNFRNVIEHALNGKRAERHITLDERNYNLIANPVYEDKRIIGAVIVIIDITESMCREQLRREFTSNVSHELKTPLTSISGFAEILKLGGIPDETVINFSSSIYDEAQRLISLVNDIMKISELDENSVPFERENINLYELASDVVKRLQPIADKKNVKINLTGDTVYILGTLKILDEIIYNLCDNAIKYNKENGTVNLILSSDKNKIKLIVSDTGIGIPNAEQSRVFERFYRVDKSHSKLVGGTGLGLSIVKHGVAVHNGEITLDSIEGEGTTITVIFNK